MNFEKFTINAQKAVAAAQASATENGNATLEPEHLTLALLRQTDGVVPPLLGKLGVNARDFEAEAQGAVSRLSKVSSSGSASLPELSRALNEVLTKAEKEASAMKDDYVSTEHLFLALVERGLHGLKRKDVLRALTEIRGSARVTDQNPEDTFQALEKYAKDLTALARQGKLDPVI